MKIPLASYLFIRRAAFRWLSLLFLLGWLPMTAPGHGQTPTIPGDWWSEQTVQALVRAGGNALGLRHALDEVPVAQRESLEFLLENMPERDLRSLTPASLLDNVAQATSAWEQAPWAQTVPADVFCNEVLPYVNASETREPWREKLRAICLPLVNDCTRSGEAAQRLNERLFGAVKVRYSTGRAKADQSPAETISSGLASCTGLSILLVDACRSVGIPARLVGIPDWMDGRGNHTWVEVWDAGQWHFLGAAEPDSRGLDHAWFERDAALAQQDSPRHAIYAVSFRRTALPFPIAWGPDSGGVSAENVTSRYTADRTTAHPPAAPTTRALLCIRARPGGPRVAAQVKVVGSGSDHPTLDGKSADESEDTNNLLSFDLPQGQTFEVTADWEGEHGQWPLHTDTRDQAVFEFAFESAAKPEGSASTGASVGPLAAPTTEGELFSAASAFFVASRAQQVDWKFAPALDALLLENPAVVRRVVWEAYRQAPIHTEAAANFAEKRVRFGLYVSPYTVKTVGEKPADGWGLVIAMHGGGGAPKEVNDSQWHIMQSYYRDQSPGGYLYVALRAPNDTWNGFYDDYVYPLVENLIRQFAICEEMNLDRVDLIGYSHGGYGAFAIGPKMPDRFAAIHSSAAAPTDGLISPKTLRNTAFDFTVGEYDDAYDRRARCEAFAQSIQELRGNRTDIFPVTFKLESGRHHSDLPDHDQLREMLPRTRNPVPRELTWAETDAVIHDFYWLADPQPGKSREIDASCQGNRLSITAHPSAGSFTVRLDERLVDFRQPLVIEDGTSQETIAIHPSLATLCQTLVARGDPALAFSCELRFDVTDDGKLRRTATPSP